MVLLMCVTLMCCVQPLYFQSDSYLDLYSRRKYQAQIEREIYLSICSCASKYPKLAASHC